MICREASLANAVVPITQKNQRTTTRPTTIRCHHVLVENKSNKRQVFHGRCVLCRLLKKRCEVMYGCTGCKHCFALLYRDGGLKHITDIPTSLVEDVSIRDFLNGVSKWNLKDQMNVGTEEDMVMAYNK